MTNCSQETHKTYQMLERLPGPLRILWIKRLIHCETLKSNKIMTFGFAHSIHTVSVCIVHSVLSYPIFPLPVIFSNEQKKSCVHFIVNIQSSSSNSCPFSSISYPICFHFKSFPFVSDIIVTMNDYYYYLLTFRKWKWICLFIILSMNIYIYTSWGYFHLISEQFVLSWRFCISFYKFKSF